MGRLWVCEEVAGLMEGFNGRMGVLRFKAEGSWPGGVQGLGGGSQPGWDESWKKGSWSGGGLGGEVVLLEKKLHGPGWDITWGRVSGSGKGFRAGGSCRTWTLQGLRWEFARPRVKQRGALSCSPGPSGLRSARNGRARPAGPPGASKSPNPNPKSQTSPAPLTHLRPPSARPPRRYHRGHRRRGGETGGTTARLSAGGNPAKPLRLHKAVVVHFYLYIYFYI